MKARVLVADDQADVLTALRLLLKGEGYQVETAPSPAAVLDLVSGSDFDIALVDLNYARDTTSGQEGLDLLSDLAKLDGAPPVVVMTAWGSVELAVEAMRRGARDFIQKPWDNARLLTVLRNQIELQSAQRKGRRLEAENELLRRDGLPTLIAQSAAMKPALELIARVGPSDANVLITGEHGTGKEVVAQTLHQVSQRAGKPFVPLNIGGLAEGVFESEMFGHVKGAFTGADKDRMGRFELADEGTLFLDEIANITPQQQARLLRVLEAGEVERVGASKSRKIDVRILSATNADLPAMIAEGEFREDLLFRLNTVEIRLPPLRERAEDIPLLAAFFLEKAVRRYRKLVEGFDDSALRLLRAHPWPGNVRELDHVVQRAVLMAGGATITAADMGLAARADSAPRLEDMSLDEVERRLIKMTLERCNGSVNEAAEQLGLSRSAMYRRLQKHGL
ncbi:MAG: sigma-54-dependent Fis family transcriptional regulator [Bryobacterales bacterium]|nr:sigma-54-dependent Fis family transcriptional regulator [Acidobacteriota bacterium]MCB9383325.1 sigma-54-dependent Fis family transcriptional regulator [Bryobacterales bacterium]